MSDLNEQKIDELLKLMRSVIPDVSDMNDAGKVGFNYREDYDPEASYEKMDIVLSGNALWEAKTDIIGNPPPDQSQEGQENVKENEFWRLFLPGALGGDYVKKDDYAQVGFAGIVQPDGKTIKVGDKGLLTAGTAGFTGTKEQYTIAMAEGQIEPGTIVFITDDFVEPVVISKEEIEEIKEDLSEAKKEAAEALGILGKLAPSVSHTYLLYSVAGEFGRVFHTAPASELNCIVSITRFSSQGEASAYMVSVTYQSGVLSGKITQLANEAKHTDYFSQIRITYQDGFNIELYRESSVGSDITVSIYGISISPSSSAFSMPDTVQAIQEELPNVTYNVTRDVGLIADRAISDSEGNNIAEHITNVAYSLKGSLLCQTVDWNRILNIKVIRGCSFKLTIVRNFNQNQPENVSLQINATYQSDGTLRVFISQLGASNVNNLVNKVRVVWDDTNQFYVDIHYNATSRNEVTFCVTDFTAVREGVVMAMREIVTEKPSKYKEFTVVPNVGVIADRAQADGSGNVITETYVPLNTHEVKNFVTVLTEEELINASNEIYNSAVNHGVFEAVISVNTQGLSLVGGVWYIRGFRSSATNGFMVAERYNVTAEKPYTKTRNISGGVWGNWI